MTEKPKFVYIPQDWELGVRLWALEALKTLQYPKLDSSTVRVRYANLNLYPPKQTYVTIRPTFTEDYTFTRVTSVREGKLFEDEIYYKKSTIRLKGYGPYSNVVMTHLAASLSNHELNKFNHLQSISIPSTEDNLTNIHEDDRDEIIYVWTQEYNVDHCFKISTEIGLVENINTCPNFQNMPLPIPINPNLLIDENFILTDGNFVLTVS